jgi:membrane fusion protein (multidrug efflux system)
VLPAQNATGNWIKIVQRLPVRIQLDQRELDAHPLRIGLSMQVDVETSDASGRQLAAAVNTSYRTDVFSGYGAQADAEIARIIAQNTVGDPQAAASAASQAAKPRSLAKRDTAQRSAG